MAMAHLHCLGTCDIASAPLLKSRQMLGGRSIPTTPSCMLVGRHCSSLRNNGATQPHLRPSPGSLLRITCSDETPKGFAKKPPPPPPKKPPPALFTDDTSKQARKEESQAEDLGDDVIPEVVTNRILKRLAITVGIPVAIGLAFFPLFYYLKVIQKADLPDWLPLISSSLFFGVGGLGISYGVLSASWDPQREGSFLGWKEAQVNWPVFTQTLSRKQK